MNVSDFDYELPEQLIAHQPIEPRDMCRLMVVNRKSGTISHDIFHNLTNYLKPSDVLVFNNSKVFPARLLGHKETGGAIEVLLLESVGEEWKFIGKNIGGAKKLFFDRKLTADVQENGYLRFSIQGEAFMKLIYDIGLVPLPPYIHAPSDVSLSDYQTVYAKQEGSVAAPTAGLHFTSELLAGLATDGVDQLEVTLHVGLGTFLPMKSEKIEEHVMHAERYEISAETDETLKKILQEKKRIIGVGTTSVRTLETWGNSGKRSGTTNIFMYPGYTFSTVGAMITNFHLPKSTLLLLVSAFAGTDLIRRTYEIAIAEKYRFYSFGDAMLIV